jgi:hypothetical protein
MQRAVNSQKQSFLVRNETVKFLHSYIYIYISCEGPSSNRMDGESLASHSPTTVG